MNATLALDYFPSAYKTARVIVIPKIGENLTFPQSYRPISLLSVLGKAFERAIRDRLEEEVSKLKLIPAEQFGFRKGHSTTDQLLRLTTDVQNGLVVKKDTACIFFDISKVWHSGLLYKLLPNKHTSVF